MTFFVAEKNKIRILGFLFVLFMWVLFPDPGTAAEQALLWIDPEQPVRELEEDTEFRIRLDQAQEIYGIELRLAFPADLVQGLDANSSQPGIQIRPGSCPEPGLVVRNEVNNETGQIDYALSQMNPQPPCDGGVVAEFSMRCAAAGQGTLSFEVGVVSDRNGLPIDHVTQTALIRCEGNGQTPTEIFTLTSTWTNTPSPVPSSTDPPPPNTATPTDQPTLSPSATRIPPTGTFTPTFTSTFTPTDLPLTWTPTVTTETEISPTGALTLTPTAAGTPDQESETPLSTVMVTVWLLGGTGLGFLLFGFYLSFGNREER